jgi:hypothetical protein
MFTCFRVECLLCELIWATSRLSPASVVASYWNPTIRGSIKDTFGGEILKMETVPVRGFCTAKTYLEFLLLSRALIHFLCNTNRKYLAFEPRVETKIFVFVFSRKFRENLFSLFAKKANKKLRK